MSDVQKAMALLITSFNKYSSKEGDKYTLTKQELKDLIQHEFAELLGKADDKKAIDHIFSDLDANKDNLVDFGEYVNLICRLTLMCHEYFKNKN